MSRVFVLLAACLMLALPAWAVDESVIARAEGQAAGYRAALETIQRDFLKPAIGGEQIAAMRVKLEDVRAGAQRVAQSLASSLSEVQQQIERLGPAPAAGTSEAPGIAAQREALGTELRRLEGTVKQLELIAVEAEQLTGRAAQMQRETFFGELFRSERSILNIGLWYDGATGLADFVQRVTLIIGNWWRSVATTGDLPRLLLIPLVIVLVYVGFRSGRNWLGRYFKSAPQGAQAPDELTRLWRAVRDTVATGLLIVAIAFLVYKVGTEAGVVSLSLTPFVSALTTFIFNSATAIVLVRRLAAPNAPAWRLVDLDDQAARRLVMLMSLAAIAVSAELALKNLAGEITVPIGLLVGVSAATAAVLIVAITLLLIGLRRQKGSAPTRRHYFGWAEPLVPAVWFLLLIAGIALLLGYIALGDFLVSKLYDTSVAVVALVILHHLADAVIAAGTNPLSRTGKALRQLTGLGERGIDRLGLIARTLFDIVLVVVGVPLLLVIWTITWIDLRSWINTVFFGFRVGDMTVQPSSVFLAASILIFGVFATRLLARWLDRRVLSQTRLDKGVQNSIRTGAGYAGYVIAIGFALTAAGLDFSNIAIVAGALGVGIGFGLQSIVNNFVSGLILLAERPVRVGDWVQLGADEGIVQKINVRSTEIATFDNCAVIVPNSNLVTQVVKNWTHGDTMGRFLVQVQVSYRSSPEIVRDLLLRLAREHPQVLTYPEPSVTLAALGAGGMSFELRGHVADVFTAGPVASELRFALLKSFREAEIMLAVPVQDVRLMTEASPADPVGIAFYPASRQ